MNTTSRRAAAAGVALLLAALLAGCTTGTTGSVDGFPVQATNSTSLPADFPRVQVPLVAGRVVAAIGDAAHGWIVAVAPARDQGLAEATSRLAAAGYLTRSLRPAPASFSGPGYDVRLTDAGGTIVYAVRRR
ncbi:MAG: hypothetical protein J0I18_04855 [Actinobacteria bacterium]|nr:hypothetical protein [Actinomycetota bacterium]